MQLLLSQCHTVSLDQLTSTSVNVLYLIFLHYNVNVTVPILAGTTTSLMAISTRSPSTITVPSSFSPSPVILKTAESPYPTTPIQNTGSPSANHSNNLAASVGIAAGVILVVLLITLAVVIAILLSTKRLHTHLVSNEAYGYRTELRDNMATQVEHDLSPASICEDIATEQNEAYVTNIEMKQNVAYAMNITTEKNKAYEAFSPSVELL